MGGSAAGGAVLGVTPGVLATFGQRTKLTIGTDVPLNLAAVGGGFGLGGNGAAGFQATVRPNIAGEFPVGARGATLYAQLEVPIILGFGGVPFISVGAGF